jgi:hypothetical protein
MGTFFTGICTVPASCFFTGFRLKTDQNPKTGLFKTKTTVEHYATGNKYIEPSVALQQLKAELQMSEFG